jgi:hypothetical protein
MKLHFQKPLLSIFAVILIGHFCVAKADTSSDAETVLNWAENTYPALFPSPQATQNIHPWLFRYYQETGIYAGVSQDDNGVYVLGGPWGNNATFIGTLPDVVNLALGSGSNSGISSCNTDISPDGVFFSQSGNVVTISTNGQCIPAPDLSDPASGNLCRTPPQTVASGISILSSNTVTSAKIDGITTSAMFNPFESILAATANVKYCTINAPANMTDLVLNTDFCFDITAMMSSFPPIDGITITPPVNYHLNSTATNSVVENCFATDASAIFDAFTGEVWVRNTLTGEFISASQ